MNKIKIAIESYLPLLIAIVLSALVYLGKINTTIVQSEVAGHNVLNMFLVMATTLLAILITHKSIILTVTRNSGFKKLLRGKKATKKFFKYINRPIYQSLLLIVGSLCVKSVGISNMVTIINADILESIIVFLSSLVIGCFIRFVLIFIVIFEDSFKEEC